MKWFLVLHLLVGCDWVFRIDHIGGVADAPMDGVSSDVIADGIACYGRFGGQPSGLVCVHPAAAPASALSLPALLDTSVAATCTQLDSQPSGPELCVIIATTITINRALRVAGTRPLVLVATTTLVVDALVDGGSRGAPAASLPLGAGGGWAPCTGVSGPATLAAGGPGGTLGTLGGDGGKSAGNRPAATALAPEPVVLNGGCTGGNGASGGTASVGAGGFGGGGIYLIAGTTLTVASAATIDVSGAGGRPGFLGSTGSGGGGGGSGGMIGLDAPRIQILAGAQLVANGGGGGGGGGTTTNGGIGSDGSPLLATGGLGGASSAGSGGDGYIGVTDAVIGSDSTSSNAGGGGGGGGGGMIRFYSPDVTDAGYESPAAVTH